MFQFFSFLLGVAEQLFHRELEWYQLDFCPETLHWDGTSWSVVPVPGGSQSTALLGVAAVSSTDVWAVGESASGKKTLIEHFTCQ